MYLNKGLLLLSIIFTVACSSGTEEATSKVSYQLTKTDDKSFPLDNETAFDKINSQYSVINGTRYFHFYNRENHSLYFYDYTSAELKRKIKLDKEGPNAVKAPYVYLEYWVHDFDNIFINTMMYYYKINGDGKVLNNIVANESFSFSMNVISLDESTTYENGLLYTTNKVSSVAEGDTSYLKTVYDFNKGEPIERYFDERLIVPNFEEKAERTREMEESGMLSSLNMFFQGDRQKLYASTAISDSLYYFEDGVLKDTYFAGNPNVPSTDLDGYFSLTKVTELENMTYIGPNPTQPAHFSKMKYSSDRKYIYRFLIHGTEPKENPNSPENEVPQITGASLVVFNTETKTSGVVEIPIDEIAVRSSIGDVFVTKEGIHFPVLDQETESVKTYKVFKIEEIS